MDRSMFDRLADKFNIRTNVQLSASSEPLLSAEDEETLSSVCHSVCFILGDSIDAGKGTLYLTTRQVVWVSSAHAGLAIGLRYQQIVVHAISRDASTHAQPCIYLQLDEGSEDMMAGQDGEDSETEEDEHSAEVRLVPDEDVKVEELFRVLCDCAALNPDDVAEEDGVGEFFFDEDEIMAGLDPETRAAVVAHQLSTGLGLEEEEGAEDLQQLVAGDPGRFDDDEFDEEEGEHQAEESANGGSAHMSNGQL